MFIAGLEKSGSTTALVPKNGLFMTELFVKSVVVVGIVKNVFG